MSGGGLVGGSALDDELCVAHSSHSHSASATLRALKDRCGPVQ